MRRDSEETRSSRSASSFRTTIQVVAVVVVAVLLDGDDDGGRGADGGREDDRGEAPDVRTAGGRRIGLVVACHVPYPRRARSRVSGREVQRAGR
jgi:hypothetical protein